MPRNRTSPFSFERARVVGPVAPNENIAPFKDPPPPREPSGTRPARHDFSWLHLCRRSATPRFLFLAVVVDVYSRRVVGWSMGSRLVTTLMLDALDMALGQRDARDVIHHSVHGSQYTSIAFGQRCREAGVTLSMGSVGDCYDNALCESFFATLECELIERSVFRTRDEARLAVFDFVEAFYNRKRRHSALGYLSPVAFERAAEAAAA